MELYTITKITILEPILRTKQWLFISVNESKINAILQINVPR